MSTPFLCRRHIFSKDDPSIFPTPLGLRCGMFPPGCPLMRIEVFSQQISLPQVLHAHALESVRRTNQKITCPVHFPWLHADSASVILEHKNERGPRRSPFNLFLPANPLDATGSSASPHAAGHSSAAHVPFSGRAVPRSQSENGGYGIRDCRCPHWGACSPAGDIHRCAPPWPRQTPHAYQPPPGGPQAAGRRSGP